MNSKPFEISMVIFVAIVVIVSTAVDELRNQVFAFTNILSNFQGSYKYNNQPIQKNTCLQNSNRNPNGQNSNNNNNNIFSNQQFKNNFNDQSIDNTCLPNPNGQNSNNNMFNQQFENNFNNQSIQSSFSHGSFRCC
jgi:hypothetical protein